jgi:hypothetical protein
MDFRFRGRDIWRRKLMDLPWIIERRRLIITLGEHEAPASCQWDAVKFLRDEDGNDLVPPQRDLITATAEEVSAYLNVTLAAERDALNARVARDAQAHAAFVASAEGDIATLRADNAALEAERVRLDGLAAVQARMLETLTAQRDLQAERAALAQGEAERLRAELAAVKASEG